MRPGGALLTRRLVLAGAVLVTGGLAVRMVLPALAQSNGDAAGGHPHEDWRVDPLVGTAAPALQGPGPTGAVADLARLHGMVVLVNVWGSWCQPCWEEMPLLLRAQQRWGDQGMRLFGLNTADRPEQALRLMRDAGAMEVPTVSDPDRRRAHAWSVRGLPETFVVARDATIAGRRSGKVDQGWLDATIPPLL